MIAYTRDDFVKMTDAELFGLYCQVKTDEIPLPDAHDFERIYKMFRAIKYLELIHFLVEERISK